MAFELNRQWLGQPLVQICLAAITLWGFAVPASADESADADLTDAANSAESIGDTLTLPPDTVEQSPVLQQWQRSVPDVLDDIRNDPSFKTRLRSGYTQFPSTHQTGGVMVGVEDWFIAETPLTLNADYHRNFDGNREAFGATLRYYVLPLGGYINAAPLVGYRNFETPDYTADGLNYGFHIKVIPSRGGGADFGYTQTWTTGSDGVRTTQLGFGYAITRDLRVATDIEWQFGPGETDSRVGIGVEWMP
ncbi:MAG: hypothetical protein AAF921_02755 [Cyanobacteria bacterium P01_D01_bin.44]